MLLLGATVDLTPRWWRSGAVTQAQIAEATALLWSALPREAVEWIVVGPNVVMVRVRRWQSSTGGLRELVRVRRVLDAMAPPESAV